MTGVRNKFVLQERVRFGCVVCDHTDHIRLDRVQISIHAYTYFLIDYFTYRKNHI